MDALSIVPRETFQMLLVTLLVNHATSAPAPPSAGAVTAAAVRKVRKVAATACRPSGEGGQSAVLVYLLGGYFG